MTKEESQKLADSVVMKQIFDYAKFIAHWKDTDVYIQAFDEERIKRDGIPAVGCGPYIFVKDGKARLVSREERIKFSEDYYGKDSREVWIARNYG